MNMFRGKKENRRHMLTALGALSVLALIKLHILRRRREPVECGAPAKTEPALRLLGQDGRLVEVDPSRITVLKKKISDDELKEWVNHSL